MRSLAVRCGVHDYGDASLQRALQAGAKRNMPRIRAVLLRSHVGEETDRSPCLGARCSLRAVCVARCSRHMLFYWVMHSGPMQCRQARLTFPHGLCESF